MDNLIDMIINEFVAKYNEEVVLVLIILGVMIVPSLLVILLSIVAIITVPPVLVIYWLLRFIFWCFKKLIEAIKSIC